MKSIRLLSLGLLMSFSLYAQTIPAENDTLNYRIINFTVPENEKAVFYTFQVARGTNNNQQFFNKNSINKVTTDNAHTLMTVPKLGEDYTWSVTYLNRKKKEIGRSPLYHFRVGMPAYADTSQVRLRVINNEIANKELWLLCDGNKCMYDLDGYPVWYLKEIPGMTDADGSIRDLKITDDNTFTFLTNKGGYEVDYNCNILWSTPDSLKVFSDGSLFYHHEFTKMSNGHYMVAGKEEISVPLPADADTARLKNNNNITGVNGRYYKKIPSGLIAEYDAGKKLVWQLKLAQYFTDADYFANKLPSGDYTSETHLNSFYLDEQNNHLYTSFRNTNCVIKVTYPEGKLLARYNGVAPGNERKGDKKGNSPDDALFRGQHCVRTYNNGTLSLLNNGFEKKKNGISTVLYLKEDTENKKLEKIWEFPCNIDNQAQPYAPSGGSVYQLDNKDILVSMGSASRTFIVSPDKKVLWNAVTEMLRDDGTWQKMAQYRATPIEGVSRLQQIFQEQKNK